MKAPITPVSIFPNTATTLVVQSVSVNLGVGATGYYTLTDDSGAMLSNGGCNMNPADYANWNTDDTVAFRAIATKLGLTLTGDPV